MMPLSFPDSTGLIVFALNILLVVTLICVLALTLVRLFFQHHPTVRYYLCLIALIAILLSPFFVALQSQLGYSLVTLALPESIVPSAPQPVLPAASVAAGLPVEIDATVPAVETPRWGVWCTIGGGIALVVWTLGIGWGMVRLIRGWCAVSLLSKGITPWSDSTDNELRKPLEKALRSSLPPIYTSRKIESPLAVGLLRPMILLPEGWTEALSPLQLRQILLHECAHVAFRHLFGGFVERIARLLFWFHPLMIALCRELARSREEVCDNVASQEVGAACYARTLLALAQGTLPAPPYASTLALLGPETSLEQRISGLLHPRRNRMIPGKQGTRWAVLYATGLVLSLTLLVRVAASNQKNLFDNYTTLGPDAFFVRQHDVAIEGTATSASTDQARVIFTPKQIHVTNNVSVSKDIRVALAYSGDKEAKAGSPVAERPIEVRVVPGTPVPVEQAAKPARVALSFAVAPPAMDASSAVEELNAVAVQTPQEPKAEEPQKPTAEQEAELRRQLAERDALLRAREAEFKKREAALQASLDERTALLRRREAELAKIGADRLRQRDTDLRAREKEYADRIRNRETMLRLNELDRLKALKDREIELKKRQKELDAAAAKARAAEAGSKETRNP